MNAFFISLDYLYDIIRPVDKDSYYASCFYYAGSWFHYLGDLIRSDGLTVVALTG